MLAISKLLLLTLLWFSDAEPEEANSLQAQDLNAAGTLHDTHDCRCVGNSGNSYEEAKCSNIGRGETCRARSNFCDWTCDEEPTTPPSTSPPPSSGDCRRIIAGAGSGGVYFAWRLAKEDPQNADDICIFEKGNRIGGRLWQATCEDVPEFCERNLKAEIGGNNWDQNDHPILNALIRDVFDIPFECYDRGPDVTTCSKPTWKELRGKLLDPEQAKDSENWPYNFPPEEQFSSAEGTSLKTAYTIAEEIVAPAFAPFKDLLTDPISAVRWQAFSDSMAAIAAYEYKGVGMNELTVFNSAQSALSQEGYAAQRDGSGALVSFDIKSSRSIYQHMRKVLSQKVLDYDDSDANLSTPGEVPYNQYVREMLAELESLGGKLYLNHEVTKIMTVGDDKQEAFIYDKINEEEVSHVADVVFLNMTPTDANKLESTSNIWTEASDYFKEAWDAVVVSDSTKGFLYYPDMWWRNYPETARGNFYSASGITGRIRWHDIPDPVNRDAQHPGGVLLATYTFGRIASRWSHNANFHNNAKFEGLDKLEILRRNNPSQNLTINQLHEAIIKLVAQVPTIDPSVIPEPEYGIRHTWAFGHAVTGPTKLVPAGMYEDAIIKPLANDNVKLYIANADFGTAMWDAESSLQLTERVLNRHGLGRPWFVEEHFYNHAIAAVN